MHKNVFNAEVKQTEDGESYIELPPDLIKELGWEENDELEWNDNLDGSFSLTKKQKTKWVLVETISQFKMRYLVEVPEDNLKHALEVVDRQEAKEFSQTHVSEVIFSHRVVTEKEAIEMYDQDNDYLKSWDKATKMKNSFTSIEYLDELKKKSEGKNEAK